MNGTKKKNNKKYNSSKVAKLERTKKVRKNETNEGVTIKIGKKKRKRKREKKDEKAWKTLSIAVILTSSFPTLFSHRRVFLYLFHQSSYVLTGGHFYFLVRYRQHIFPCILFLLYSRHFLRIIEVVFVSGIPTLDRSKKFY